MHDIAILVMRSEANGILRPCKFSRQQPGIEIAITIHIKTSLHV